MNIFITIGFVAGVALVIYGVQWLVSAGVSKAQDVGEGMLYRHQVNKEGGQQLTAEDMRKANRVVKAFEKGIISEDSFDREIERIEDESFAAFGSVHDHLRQRASVHPVRHGLPHLPGTCEPVADASRRRAGQAAQREHHAHGSTPAADRVQRASARQEFRRHHRGSRLRRARARVPALALARPEQLDKDW